MFYCCPETECDHVALLKDVTGLRCPNGHFFLYVPGTEIPVFTSESENVNEYTSENAAEIHDNSLRWLFDTFGTDEHSFRKTLIAKLDLRKGMKILVTGVGAGNDLPYLVESMAGEGVIFAQDISKQMLLAGAERTRAKLHDCGVEFFFSVSDATHLPFPDNVFDAAYHFGGLNLFPDIQKGIAEMNRVVKPDGKIVVGDEGVAPWLKQTEYGQMLIKNNPLCAYDAPLSLLPESAKSVKLSWELDYYFYVIEFIVADSGPKINIDIPHVGKRGGSIRTRYFGQLEGIDPELRDKIYAEAEKQGISRVEYLESLLKKGIS
ncbi:MAG: hypothetical protein BWK78_03010 [Thiotrichaceae bacterium IS1]|nr:MAG: hypothetical protein BWK78_03010 [Thiotrichaceae bacterium IS1]